MSATRAIRTSDVQGNQKRRVLAGPRWAVAGLLLAAPLLSQPGDGGFQYWEQSHLTGATIQAGDRFGDGFASGDFNGDGKLDLAVAESRAEVDGVVEAGLVHVLYYDAFFDALNLSDYTSFGLGQFYTGGSPDAGARFGAALASADFDGDGYDDLAVGAPYESVETDRAPQDDAGLVVVLYGSPLGLDVGDFQFLQDDTPEDGEYFGTSLVAARFDGGIYEDLMVGVPGQGLEVTGPVLAEAGKIMGYVGTPGQLAWTGPLTQDQAGGAIEAGDQFGAVLAAGDLNGDGIGDIVVGAYEEDVGASNGAGAVSIFYSGLSTVDETFSQADLAGVSVEAGDAFGWALATGDFDGDDIDDLVVGVPFEAVGALGLAGIVHVIPGSSTGVDLAAGAVWEQADTGIASNEANDLFGWTVGAGDFDGDGFDDLLAGAPGESLNGNVITAAGAAIQLSGTAAGLTSSGAVLWTQASFGSSTIEVGDSASDSLLAADLNGDGAAEIVLGASLEDDQTQNDTGALQVFYTDYGIFSDGFESGDTSSWSSSAP